MVRLERLHSDNAPEGASDGAIGLILLDRREKRNALTPDMLRNLAECVQDAARGADGGPRARAIVIAGEGEAFSAGFDLKLCRDDELAVAALLTALTASLAVIRKAPCPVIAAAHGAAIAGASAILAACDFVVTNAGASVGYPVVRLGMSPAVSAPMLERAIGAGAARDRLLDPALLDGREAGRLGLAHTVVDRPEQVRGVALALARRLAAKPAHAMAATKRWLNEVDGSLDEAAAQAALADSLAIAGNEEERRRLAGLWT